MQINHSIKPLLAHKAEYLNKIDELAGQVRARFLTVTPGQELTYLMKLNEAKAYPQTINPWIAAESLATGKTEAQVVESILASANVWESVGVLIESSRLGAKGRVNSATTATEMYAAFSAISSTLQELYP